MLARRIILFIFLAFIIVGGFVFWSLFAETPLALRLYTINNKTNIFVSKFGVSCWSPFSPKQKPNMRSPWKCTMPVFQSNEATDTIGKSELCPLCDSQTIKNYYRRPNSSGFLSDGFWNIEYFRDNRKYFSFQPSFCKYSNDVLSSSYIVNCLVKKNISKIVTMGDSNGKRIFIGLTRVLSIGGVRCRKIKQEGDEYDFSPHLNYYLGPRKYNNSDIAVSRRSCRSCQSQKYACRYNVTKQQSAETQMNDMTIEHLAIDEIFGQHMRILSPIDDIKPTNFSDEIVFKYYLKDNYPDVLLILVPCTHIADAGSLASENPLFKGLLDKFVTLLKKTVPKSTSIFWLPGLYHFVGGDRVKTLRLCNEIVLETLKTEFQDPNGNMHATLDLLELSCSIQPWLKEDRAHLQEPFYVAVTSQIMQQLCN